METNILYAFMGVATLIGLATQPLGTGGLLVTGGLFVLGYQEWKKTREGEKAAQDARDAQRRAEDDQ